MKQEVTNFGQFYALLRQMPYAGDKEDLKSELVLQHTGGRTESLKEVTQQEYVSMLKTMKKVCPADDRERSWRKELRRWRSVCLKLMREIGIDTEDWSIINKFTENKRIAGKTFRELSTEELEELSRKLRMIRRKQQEK